MRRQVKEEIIREGRETVKKKIPNGGVTDRFSGLFTHPLGGRVSLDRFYDLDFCLRRLCMSSGGGRVSSGINGRHRQQGGRVRQHHV